MHKKWHTFCIWLLGIAYMIQIVRVGMYDSAYRVLMDEDPESIEGYIDAEAYYEETSDILKRIPADESPTVQTGREIIKDMRKRGFRKNPIYTDYTLTGRYLDEQKVTRSSRKYPSYQTMYVSKANELWTIITINGCVMANPVLYNLSSKLGAQIVLAESDSIMVYDGPTNMFYEVVPKTDIIVKVVDRIDAKTLDGLTEDEIGELK